MIYHLKISLSVLLASSHESMSGLFLPFLDLALKTFLVCFWLMEFFWASSLSCASCVLNALSSPAVDVLETSEIPHHGGVNASPFSCHTKLQFQPSPPVMVLLESLNQFLVLSIFPSIVLLPHYIVSLSFQMLVSV